MAKQIAAPKRVAKSKTKTVATTKARATRPELRARKAAAAGVTTKALAVGAGAKTMAAGATPTTSSTPRKSAVKATSSQTRSGALGYKKKTASA
jgi:hypothetical protein